MYLQLCNNIMVSFTAIFWISHKSIVRNLNYHSNCTSLKIIWMTVFGPCVRQITSRCVIWNAQSKWRSGCVFQWCISQIMQRNRHMNALTSKLWFGGGAMWPSNPFLLHVGYTARCIMYRSIWNASSVHVWLGLIGRVPRYEPRIFSRSRMLNRKFGLSCVHCVIQISQLLLSCVHCVIWMIIQIAHLCSHVKTVTVKDTFSWWYSELANVWFGEKTWFRDTSI